MALATTSKRHDYWLSEPPATAFTPSAATSTVVPTTVAPTLTVVATTVTAASATAITAQPLQLKIIKRHRKPVRIIEYRYRLMIRKKGGQRKTGRSPPALVQILTTEVDEMLALDLVEGLLPTQNGFVSDVFRKSDIQRIFIKLDGGLLKLFGIKSNLAR